MITKRTLRLVNRYLVLGSKNFHNRNFRRARYWFRQVRHVARAKGDDLQKSKNWSGKIKIYSTALPNGGAFFTAVRQSTDKS